MTEEILKWLQEQKEKSLNFYKAALNEGDEKTASNFMGEYVAFSLCESKIKEINPTQQNL